MPELPLALGDGGARAATDARHVVRVQLAELGLTRRQSGSTQTAWGYGRAAEHVQLVCAAAPPDVGTVHAQMPANNRQRFVSLHS